MVLALVRVVRGQPPLTSISSQPLNYSLALIVERVDSAIHLGGVGRVDDHDIAVVKRSLRCVLSAPAALPAFLASADALPEEYASRRRTRE